MTTIDIETGIITGTLDKNYDLIWFTEVCLSNALRLETFVADAERAGDREVAAFFRRAQVASRKGADQAKELMLDRLAPKGVGPPMAEPDFGSGYVGE